MNLTVSLAQKTNVSTACSALNVPRCSLYRWREPKEKKPSQYRPPLALSYEERNEVLGILHDDRFIDKAPQEIYAALLDEEKYLCSTRTMYRILERHGELKERRNQLTRPHYTKPELLAQAPNEVWSWDISAP